MTRRRMRGAAAVLVLAVCLTTACGARLTSAQRLAALNQQNGTNGGDSGSGGSGIGSGVGGTGSSTAGGTGTKAGTTQGGTGSAGGSRTTAGKAGGGGSSGAAGAPTCAAGGSRGATATGVTANSITIANVSDISGPVPGLFTSAQDAVKAYVAYFNSTGQTVCGRHLNLINLDSQTDQNADRAATIQACSQAFAMVGSISAFDQGGAQPSAQCGIPDLRVSSNTTERASDPVSFGVSSSVPGLISSTTPDYFKNKYGAGMAQHAAYLYINVGVGAEQEASIERAYSQRGYNFVYTQAIDISDFNYTPYVIQMQRKGVRFVQFLGAYQEAAKLAQAMQQQSFKPDVFLLDPTGYNPDYVAQAQGAATGTYVYDDAALFEEAAANPELSLYLTWLHRVDPSGVPSFFGEFAWSAARLFTQLAASVGPNLTRPAMLAAIKGVHSWTGNGMHAAQDVGGKRTGPCFAIIRYTGSAWARQFPSSGYSCGTLISTGLG